MKLMKNSNYWFSSGYLFTFYAAWSLWWSFYSIWLEEKLHLKGAQLGFVYAVNSAAAIFFMIFYGIIQDKLKTGKGVVTFQSIVMLLIGPFFIYVYEPLLSQESTFYFGVILGAPVLCAGFVSGSPLIESFVERISRLYGFEYGSSRFWGSFGYAVAALAAGIMFSINPHINFWCASAIAVLFFINNMFFKPKQPATPVVINNEKPSIPSLSEVFSLLGMIKFWVFVFFVIGTYSFYTIYDQQLFPNFYKTFFTDPAVGSRVYGYLNSLQVFLEACCMVIAPFFIYKMGPKKSLVVAALVMVCRIGLSATFDNIYIISVIKLFHAIEIPLFILAMFKYVVANFDPRLSSTLYLVGFNISSNLGIIALSIPVGRLFDDIGYSSTFYVLAGVVVVITLISIFTLSDGRKLRKEDYEKESKNVIIE